MKNEGTKTKAGLKVATSKLKESVSAPPPPQHVASAH